MTARPFVSNSAVSIGGLATKEPWNVPDTDLLRLAAAHAADYIENLDGRPIKAMASPQELHERLGKPLPESGMAPEQVIDELVRDARDGLLGSTNGRFFSWVIGGTLPAALAADWLTSTWDQNAASNVTAPAEAVVEEICGAWLKELLGLPASASFGFVTGCQMAHTTALAAARHRLLGDRGWDVEAKGLAGAPTLRVLTSETRHESIMRSIRLLGIGTDAMEYVDSDNRGRIHPGRLSEALERSSEAPTIVCLQAGDLNTGIFDSFKEICPIAQAHRAWVHIDGAFGLWAAASQAYRHLLEGAEQADSWATDGHKWLNLPFDSGFVFVADPSAHSAAFSQATSYATPIDGLRNQKDWNPEWSRRGRGFAAYAAIRSLGRSGIAEMVERCCAHADRLVRGIGGLPGAEILTEPIINQGLVRFLANDGDHDRQTDAVIERIQDGGIAFFGGVTWRGTRAMRISVCNWATSDSDIDRSIETVRDALTESST
jgi:glutamate/tyrosine decarboxylase-like PLP-dependent enzyme